MEYAKISVLIVTYRQADVIGRNIESILKQKEYGLHEIVICDDCSPDNNWEVIQGYVKKYPDIIRAYRNELNLGIYGNSDKLVGIKGNADLYCWLEGDDALCHDFFKNIQEVIIEKSINIKERVGILCNWKTINPKGNERTTYNSAVEVSNLEPISLYFRGLATWRGAVFSSRVLDSFKPTILDKGLQLAETLFDSQFFANSDKLYYKNCDGTIYYSDIGISTILNKKSSYRREDAITKLEYISSNYPLSQFDKEWIIFLLYKAKMNINPSLSNLLRALKYYNKGIYKGPGCFKNRTMKYIVPLFARLLRLK